MCECIKKLNSLLEEKQIKASVITAIPLTGNMPEKVIIPLMKDIKAKTKLPTIVATYCPMCGEKYSEVS
jgi:F0F1-type ATP synthase delta subunit